MSKQQDFRDFVLNHEFDQFAKDEEGRAIFHLWQDEYEALQSAMATAGGGLSSVAQKKLEQMGATVHGVLVKNEAGALAAVHDLGRVTWLDDCAQQAGSGEAVADQWLIQMRGNYLVTRGVWERPDHRGYTNDINEAGRYSEEEAKEAERVLPEKCKAIRLPYTHPQPAQQGSVPEGWRVARANHSARAAGIQAEGFLIQSPRANGVAANTAVWEDSENPAERLLYLMLAATPQPEGDGWVPQMNDEIRWILGRPNFSCAGIAQYLRAQGREIQNKAEDEQAEVIHWMLELYSKHGAEWRTKASELLSQTNPPAEQEGE